MTYPSRPASRWQPILLAMWFGLALPTVLAHEPREPADAPGFRPDSEYAESFVAAFETATIVVHPTIVRRRERTAHSYASQARAIEQLDSAGIAAVRGVKKVKLGALRANSQWRIFTADLEAVSDAVKGRQSGAEYHLVMEFILPVSDADVFGIHCFIVNQNGDNAFSFLLNSHHRIFVDAGLHASDNSEEARSAMFLRASDAAVAALRAQVNEYRARSQRAASREAALAAGEFEELVLDDFNATIPSMQDAHGNALGFNAFSGPGSAARFSLTREYPPIPGEPTDNQVLRLDVDVRDWAVFAHLFYFVDADETRWMTMDWRRYDGIAFWLYGQNSGAQIFVDLFDNRHPGSTSDDAERFVYGFRDDFSGWRRISIAFDDFVRKEIYNGAPNDGMGLVTVHGWAIGATQTNGPVTYYIDDFSLQHVGPDTHEGVAVGGDDTNYAVNELPMYGLREKTDQQKKADQAYIAYMTKGGRSREDAAQVAAKNAWNTFYAGDKATAIKRFNQAWLLDPGNQLALWGFAVTCVDRGQLEQAAEYFRMALESGPSNPALERDQRLLLQRLERSSRPTPTKD